MREWFVFIFLSGFAWGASYLWIKVALQELGPFTLVTYRIAFGAVATWLLLYVMKLPVELSRKRLLATIVAGLIGLALPATLLAWGETRIDSGLAGLLNGTVILWTSILAHLVLRDERMTPLKAMGLAVGFTGLVILIVPDLNWQGLREGSIWGQLAVIGMAISYAVWLVFTHRYLQGQHPLITSAVSITAALVIMLIVTPFFEPKVTIPRQPLTWLACGWLGVIGLTLALWANYYLVNHWGASRSALVSLATPVAAVALGVIILGERMTWHLIVGGVLIIASIALVNARRIFLPSPR